MADDTKPPRCLSCNQAVPQAIDVCLACGGHALVQSLETGSYSVAVGPITSLKFRKDAAALLGEVLDNVTAAEAEQALSTERVRVCQNLDKPVADALVARLGPRETLAEAVTGEPESAGSAPGFQTPLPYLAFMGGLVLGWLLWFPLGLLVGLGGAVALGLRGRGKRRRVLGFARCPTPLPRATTELLHRTAAALGTLEGAQKKQLSATAVGYCDLTSRLARKDLLGAIAGGAAGGMGEAATGLLEAAVAAAEQATQEKGSPAAKEAEATLARLAETAAHARGQVGELERAMEGGQDVRARLHGEVDSLRKAVTSLARTR
ncbi:MAG: hypothetical protein HYZ53_08620 [Planctomycetes bacterium]|nr:hypothetical protein [Planctomycetota bacterium]